MLHVHGIRQIWCQKVIKIKTAEVIRNDQYLINCHCYFRENKIIILINRININIDIQGNTKNRYKSKSRKKSVKSKIFN